MERETIYNGLFDRTSFTLLLLCNDAVALENAKDSLPKTKKSLDRIDHLIMAKRIVPNESGQPQAGDSSALGEEDDSEDAMSFVFEPEDSDDPDYSESARTAGQTGCDDACSEYHKPNLGSSYDEFIKKSFQNKVDMKRALENGDLSSLQNFVGAEHYIAGACTFHIRHINHGTDKRIAHITFLSVRKQLRHLGIGAKLIELVKQRTLTGPVDAIVVHADRQAIPFFQKLHFFDDPMLNTAWFEFADEYTNCRLMTFLPSYLDSENLCLLSSEKSLAKYKDLIEKQTSDWRLAAESAYKCQFQTTQRMLGDIMNLCDHIKSQDNLIQDLMKEIRTLKHENQAQGIQIRALLSKSFDNFT